MSHFGSLIRYLLLLFLKLLLSQLLLGLNCWPVDAIADWLTGAAKDGKWVEKGVVSKDLFEVFLSADVVRALVRLTLLIQVFNGGLVSASEIQMKLQKCCHEAHDCEIENEGHDDHHVLCKLWVVV